MYANGHKDAVAANSCSQLAVDSHQQPITTAEQGREEERKGEWPSLPKNLTSDPFLVLTTVNSLSYLVEVSVLGTSVTLLQARLR